MMQQIKTYRAKLTRHNHDTTNDEGSDSLRTETVEGIFENPPRAGKAFVILGPPIVEGTDARVVATSPVRAVRPIREKTIIEFETANSVYSLVLEKPADSRLLAALEVV